MIAWIKNHWLATTIGFLVIAGGAYGIYILQAPESPEIIRDTVARGDLQQTIDVAGEVESLDEVRLSFESPGTVEEIVVAKEQVVEKGGVLASLEASEREADVAQAQRAVDIARANLVQKRAGSTGEAVQVAQAALDVAQANKESAEVALENAREDLDRTKESMSATVNQAETELQSAQDDLEQIRISNTENIRHAREDLVPVLKSSMVSVRSALSQADEVIGVDNSLANDEFENVLSAINEQYLIWAENSYEIAKESRDKAEGVVFDLEADDDRQHIDQAVNLTKNALSDADETLLQTRRVLDATTIDTAQFSFAELSNLKTAVDTERNSVRSADNALVAQVQALEQARTGAQSGEITAQNIVEKARRSLEKAESEKDQRISAAQAAVNLAESTLAIRTNQVSQSEADLAQTKADPRDIDVASLEAEVERALSQLEAAKSRLEKTVLRSPISGTVTKIDIEEGEQVNASTPIITVQTTEEEFRIVIDIPEADVAKVSLDDPSRVTFDAFGDDQVFDGRVINIDPAEKLIEGVVYYEGEVVLDEDPPVLKPGLSTDVTITTGTAENVLHVPQRAILEYNSGQKYIRILTGEGEYAEQIVTIGMRADGGRREITNGLEEGQEIVVTIRE